VREQACDWLLRVQASPEDCRLRDDLEAWLSASEANRQAYRSVERMWRLSGELPHGDTAQAGGAARRSGRARWSAGRAGRTPKRVRLGAGLAAALALSLLLLPYLQLRLEADYLTGTGEILQLALDDGSLVHLDAQSAIAVRYSQSRREITLLSGQAFFEVAEAPTRPFVVVAEEVTTTATGTAFAVHALAGSVTVSLQSGTVEVAAGGGIRQAARLAPGERAVVDRASGRIARSQVAVADIGSWQNGRLVVDGARLAEVMEELDRHHAGFIFLRDERLADRRVTGVFDLDHPIEALRALAQSQQGTVLELTPYLLVVTAR